MIGKDGLAGSLGAFGHIFAWIAHTEQIWFPMFGAYVKFIQPIYDLPDLRGPMIALTLAYIGLRIGDLWNKRGDTLEDTL